MKKERDMEPTPLVSVVMPVYNGSAYLPQSIESVLNQTYQNWELLAVDDCSTDDSIQIVKDYAGRDRRVRYICLEKNSGAAVARNRGIQEARGEYIAFLDSDDLWRPEKLDIQVSFMECNDVAFSCTAYGYLDSTGRMEGKANFPFATCGYWKCLYFGNCIGNSTVLYRVKDHGKIYVPEIRKRNDFALWLKILRSESHAVGIQQILADYRIHRGSLSAGKTGLVKYQWQLYRHLEKLPLFHCVAALACLFLRKMYNPNVRKVK